MQLRCVPSVYILYRLAAARSSPASYGESTATNTLTAGIPMSAVGIALAMGVTTRSLEELLAGKASVAVALKLGTLTSSVQDFIDGRVGIGMAHAMGMLASNAQMLRNSIGREGAIGLVIGMCIARHAAENR